MFEDNVGAQGMIGLMETSGALLSGHFVLSSGLHSDKYIQCALLLEMPDRAELVGRTLARQVEGTLGLGAVDVVANPAMGGIIIGHEVARALGVRCVFTERVDGAMTLRRGFRIRRGERVLVVEDVVTTGGSTKEVMGAVSALGGVIAAAGAVVDRGGGRALGIPFAYLVRAEIENYSPEVCPMCKAGMRLTKPGSRTTQEAEGR